MAYLVTLSNEQTHELDYDAEVTGDPAEYSGGFTTPTFPCPCGDIDWDITDESTIDDDQWALDCGVCGATATIRWHDRNKSLDSATAAR